MRNSKDRNLCPISLKGEPSASSNSLNSCRLFLIDCLSMRLDELNCHLPADRIAQRPLDRRDDSRLLQLSRSTGALKDQRFVDLPDLLRGDELVVLNNTRVI